MVPNHSKYMHISNHTSDLVEWSREDFEIYIPVKIINCQLPIIALEHHDVNFVVTIQPPNHYIVNYDDKFEYLYPVVELYHNMVYLDSHCRRELADTTIERTHMIRQIQFNGKEYFGGDPCFVRLNYNHPVTCIYFHVTDGVGNLVSGLKFDATINIDGVSIVCESSNYFNQFLPRKYLKLKNGFPDGLYYYNFNLNPLDSKLSGSLNFSKVDSAHMRFNIKNIKDYENIDMSVYVYTEYCQPLRILSGMAGLAFSK